MNQTIPLFGEDNSLVSHEVNRNRESILKTEGVKYAGSKLKIIPKILSLADRVGAKSVLDGFSGTTRVSQAFAKAGYSVISNDSSVWSEVFATCYLKAKEPDSYYKELIQHLNSLSPVDGWFTHHYGGEENGGSSIQSDGLKKPWQIHNTRKLDAIREEIDKLELVKSDEAVALTSLMLALDKVDNTLGHFTSYLREWSARSYKDIYLEIPKIVRSKEIESHCVSRSDIFNAVDNFDTDLSYFDPPYGSNNEKMPPSRVRYRSYYHLWTTVCLNDKPEIFGKSKRRKDSSDSCFPSVFEDFRRNEEGDFVAVKAIEELISKTKSRWVILSYSSGGRATAEELDKTLKENGRILEVIELDYKKNIMSEMKWTNEWLRENEEKNKEFLFLLDKHA